MASHTGMILIIARRVPISSPNNGFAAERARHENRMIRL